MLSKLFSRKKTLSNCQLSLVLQPSSIIAAYVSADQQLVKQLPIQDGDYVSAINTLEKELSFKHSVCQIVLCHGLFQTTQVDNPNVPQPELRQALSWSSKELFTIKAEDQLIDYYQHHSNNPSLNKLVVVAADRAIIAPVITLLHQLEVDIAGITIEDIAVTSLVAQEKPTVLVFHMPGSQVLIAIINNGKLCFSRRIHGYDNLHQMSETDFASGVLTNLGLEIQRSIDYALGQLRLDNIESIYMLVQNFDLEPLLANIQELFDISVQSLSFDDAGELSRFPVNIAAFAELDIAGA